MTKPTIVDIADALGITPSTVSRALAGNPNVKESTRKSVLQKADELGYQRNVIASSFRKGVTNTIGVVVPRIDREFFSKIIGAAEFRLNAAGYSVVICQTREKAANERKALKMLSSIRVAGIMISHSSEAGTEDALVEALSGGAKLVQFDRVYAGLPGSTVENDDFNGAYAATKHLIDNGYKRIGAINGLQSTIAYQNRYKGYLAALADSGIPSDGSIVFPDSIVRENGFTSAGLAIDRGCDALYCTGDFSAFGAMECALSRGLRIPEDFGIVGTANEGFTALVTPSLSSVDQHADELGDKAARAMLNLLNGREEPEHIIVGVTFIPRHSSSR